MGLTEQLARVDEQDAEGDVAAMGASEELVPGSEADDASMKAIATMGQDQSFVMQLVGFIRENMTRTMPTKFQMILQQMTAEQAKRVGQLVYPPSMVRWW